MGIDAVNGISLFRPIAAAGSVEGINGGARKIARTGGNPFAGGGTEGGAISGRAVDNAPRAQMVNYTENLRAQGGYDSGVSTKFLIA